jgi:hypothetical protein
MPQAFAVEDLDHPCFDHLPRHGISPHDQRMAQVDHVIDEQAEEVVDGWQANNTVVPAPENCPCWK